MRPIVNYSEIKLWHVLFCSFMLFVFTLGYASAVWVGRGTIIKSMREAHESEVKSIILESELRLEKSKVKELKAGLNKAYSDHTYKLEATGYSLTKSQTDSDPEWSALGPTVYGQAAICQNLIQDGSFSRGDHLLIMLDDGSHHFRVVNDKMNRRYKNNIDLLFRSTYKANMVGRQNARVVNLTKVSRDLERLW